MIGSNQATHNKMYLMRRELTDLYNCTIYTCSCPIEYQRGRDLKFPASLQLAHAHGAVLAVSQSVGVELRLTAYCCREILSSL